jgi:hypothetical protein
MLSSQFRQSSSWHDPAEAIASSPPDPTCTPLVSRCTARVSPRRMPPRTKLDDRFEFPPATAGIVAFRPTYGRVSSRGTVPNSWTYQVGPLCRAVEDTAIMLGTIAGYDELDPASVDVPVPKYGLAFQAQVGFSAGPLFRRSRPGGRQGSGASTYLEARRQLDVLRRQIRNVFTNVDLLILPTVPSPPVPIGQGAEPTAVSPTQHSSLCCSGAARALPSFRLYCRRSAYWSPNCRLAVRGVNSSGAGTPYERETEWHKRHPKLNLA